MVSPLLMLLLAGASAFAPPRAAHAPLRASAAPKLSSIVMEDRVFALKIPLGDAGTAKGQAVRAVCTKDGPGGEKVGDVLRYCTEYKMQLAGQGPGGGGGGGILTTVASFGGVLSYQLGLFDVYKAKTWDDVV